jgi:YD repeat-containing protein
MMIKVKPLASLKPGEAPDSNTLYIDSSGALVTTVGAGASVAATETNWAVTYSYNANGTVATETRTAGTTTQTRSYGYDASGNLISIGAWV